MEEYEEDLDWSFWLHCEPTWSFGTKEKQWLLGTGDAAVARGVGFIMAAVVGIACAFTGFESILLKNDTTGYLHLAIGLSYIVMGGCVCQGKRWACLGLMAMFTLDCAARNLTAYTHGSPYYMDHLGFWIGQGLLAWAAWMRVYFVAYRVEQQRVNRGRSPAPEPNAATSQSR